MPLLPACHRSSFRQPVRSLMSLLRNRGWLIAFATETGGLDRLRGGAAVSAAESRADGQRVRYRCPGRAERARPSKPACTVVSSSRSSPPWSASSSSPSRPSAPTPVSHSPDGVLTVIWLTASAGAAVALMVVRTEFRARRAARHSLPACCSPAAMCRRSSSLSAASGWWLCRRSSPAYATGTGVLQRAFQHGSALTAAGLATLVTNAVPIAAGVRALRRGAPP